VKKEMTNAYKILDGKAENRRPAGKYIHIRVGYVVSEYILKIHFDQLG
jgi:hypothetical protein